jgi:hypothetical protein
MQPRQTYFDRHHRDRGQFMLKLQGAEMEVKEAIERSRDAILLKVGYILLGGIKTRCSISLSFKLDAGPHDLISEPHIKEIWKSELHFRISALCV